MLSESDYTFKYADRCARAKVRRYWPAVAAVAEALIEYGHLGRGTVALIALHAIERGAS